MPRVVSHRKPSLLLFLLLSLHLVLMASSVRGVRGGSLLEDTLLTLFSPFLRGASGVTSGFASTWHRYVALRDVEEENRRLRARVGTLTLEARAAEEARPARPARRGPSGLDRGARHRARRRRFGPHAPRRSRLARRGRAAAAGHHAARRRRPRGGGGARRREDPQRRRPELRRGRPRAA